MSITIALILAATAIRSGGDMRDAAMRPPSGASPMVINSQPFARTVTCTGARTLTGTATGAGAVTWSASPDGASGACTGTTSWSCPVAVSPNAAGEGVETITVSQSGGGSATVTLGFYVAGAHSCFLAQSYDGAYNAGKLNLAAVGTWVNLGSSALNVTQATGSAQPTYRTGIVNGQPVVVVQCDGGDRLAAATASDWTFMNSGVDWSMSAVAATASSNPNAISVVAASSTGNPLLRGFLADFDDRSSVSRNDAAVFYMANGTVDVINGVSANDTVVSGLFHSVTWWLDDDAGAGADAFIDADGTVILSAASTAAYSALAPNAPINICATSTGTLPTTGDISRVIIYSSALTATQRGINLAVDEWALGSTFPVTP